MCTYTREKINPDELYDCLALSFLRRQINVHLVYLILSHRRAETDYVCVFQTVVPLHNTRTEARQAIAQSTAGLSTATASSTLVGTR